MPKTDEVLAANNLGIECPACGCTDSSVKDSRQAASSIVRRRLCAGCGERFSTSEHCTSPGTMLYGVAAVSLSETANQHIAMAVRAKRVSLLMTQIDLAKRLGVSTYTVGQVEKHGILSQKLQQLVCSWLLSVK